MKKESKRKSAYEQIPDLMFQDVRIPESLAPTPINPALDEANQLNIPRNPSSLYWLDWDVPNEPAVTDKRVHATPNPHTSLEKRKSKK